MEYKKTRRQNDGIQEDEKTRRQGDKTNVLQAGAIAVLSSGQLGSVKTQGVDEGDDFTISDTPGKGWGR
jgi:hypothetical protein